MDIRFRQGLVALPANSIQLNGSGGIDIVINGRPIIASVANGTANYTISEARSASNAWGPFAGSTTQYLYWQINQRTGEITRGATVYWPDVRATAPTEVLGRLWWDTTTNRMKYWNGSVWEVVLIVFAATLSSGGILQPQPVGSQVGITAAPGEPSFSSGYILRDGLGNALKTSNAGEFLTSETPLISVDTGSLVKFEGSQLVAVANNPLAAFDVVYMVGNSMVDKASGLNLDADSSRAPMGIVTAGVIENETVQVITAGKVVVNEQWNWSQFEIGKSVYCNDVGQMTLTKPSGYKNVRVGIITGTNSILLTFDWETDIPPQFDAAGIQQIHVNAPITKTGVPTAPMIGITRASQTSDGYLHRDDFWRIVLLENQKANINHTHVIGDVDELQSALNSKAELLHTHTQADIQGLPLALANKSDVGHIHGIADITGLATQLNDIITLLGTKADRAIGTISGNFALVNGTGNYYDSGLSPANFSLTGHQHDISDVNLLQDALAGKSDINHVHSLSDVIGLESALDNKAEANHTHWYEDIGGLTDALAAKADVAHTHEISNVNGLQLALDAKASITHTHAIADVVGLQLTLDAKANTIHVHAIADVTGLQAALDDKASISHVHSIAQVTGLQVALDSKANTVHTHAISDVTGLQDALDGKANISHDHTISDVTGLQDALDARIEFGNTTPFTPSGQYNPATKKYVDDKTLDSLLDVNAPSPSTNQLLGWNGSAWVAVNPPSGGGGGASTVSPTTVFVYSYDSDPLPFDGAPISSQTMYLFEIDEGRNIGQDEFVSATEGVNQPVTIDTSSSPGDMVTYRVTLKNRIVCKSKDGESLPTLPEKQFTFGSRLALDGFAGDFVFSDFMTTHYRAGVESLGLYGGLSPSSFLQSGYQNTLHWTDQYLVTSTGQAAISISPSVALFARDHTDETGEIESVTVIMTLERLQQGQRLEDES